MDPLSITAAAISLATALKTSTAYLVGLRAKVRDAPTWIRIALAEVSTIEKAFQYLNAYATNKLTIPPSRAAMLQVDYLLATITSAVLFFSELEKLLKPFEALEDTDGNVLDRLKAAFHEEQVQSQLGRLQWHKHTFNMILNVVQLYGVMLHMCCENLLTSSALSVSPTRLPLKPCRHCKVTWNSS